MNWIAIMDIVLLIAVVVVLYLVFRKTVIANLYLLVIGGFLLSELLENIGFFMLSTLLGQMIILLTFALIVVFQPELRRQLLRLGSTDFPIKKWLRIGRSRVKKRDKQSACWEIVLKALENLATEHKGALIVLCRKNNLSYYTESGVMLDAKVNSRLIESIFQDQSPLHDGAVIIKGDRIVSASAILPVSEEAPIPGRMGLRHRAAMGLVQRTDAIAIVLSEESGQLFMAYDDTVLLDVRASDILEKLAVLYKKTEVGSQ